jgi:hypothetical protein
MQLNHTTVANIGIFRTKTPPELNLLQPTMQNRGTARIPLLL